MDVGLGPARLDQPSTWPTAPGTRLRQRQSTTSTTGSFPTPISTRCSRAWRSPARARLPRCPIARRPGGGAPTWPEPRHAGPHGPIRTRAALPRLTDAQRRSLIPTSRAGHYQRLDRHQRQDPASPIGSSSSARPRPRSNLSVSPSSARSRSTTPTTEQSPVAVTSTMSPPARHGFDLAGIDSIVVGGRSSHPGQPMEMAWASDAHDAALVARAGLLLQATRAAAPSSGPTCVEADGSRWISETMPRRPPGRRFGSPSDLEIAGAKPSPPGQTRAPARTQLDLSLPMMVDRALSGPRRPPDRRARLGHRRRPDRRHLARTVTIDVDAVIYARGGRLDSPAP